MTTNDTMLRVFPKTAGLRGLACVTTELAREAAQRHRAAPLAAAALSEGVTAAALLGGLLKVQQRVAIKIEGDGPLGKLVAEADAYGRVRGYVAVADLPSPLPVTADAVAAALGQAGLLTVVKDLGLRDLYQGAVALQAGGVTASLIHYFTKSEQTPTLVQITSAWDANGVLTAAGGLLFQPLPGADPSVMQQVAENVAGLPPLAGLLAAGYALDEYLAQALHGFDYTLLEKYPLAFACSCSRDRSRQALKVLSEDDLLALIVEGEAVIDCHFCHERYIFSREELAEILDEQEAENLAAMFADDTDQA